MHESNYAAIQVAELASAGERASRIQKDEAGLVKDRAALMRVDVRFSSGAARGEDEAVVVVKDEGNEEDGNWEGFRDRRRPQ